MTNFERIKTMNIEEMAWWTLKLSSECETCAYFDKKGFCIIDPFPGYDESVRCKQGHVEWLQQEADAND